MIPKEAREALKLKPGDRLMITVHDDRVIIMQKPKSYADALRGLAKGLYPPDYLQKERDSWD